MNIRKVSLPGTREALHSEGIGMDTIKKMLLILVLDTLVMLISWAGLSLILLGVRELSDPQAALVKILSLHSFVVVLLFYAFYLVFDICEFISTESRGK